MRKLLPLILLASTLAGCANSNARRVETPVNVTHEVAFGDYRRVFNTTYHIVNRYGVVQSSSYRYGEITALIGEDTSLFDKTRKTIQARIIDTGDYWDVQCRVLIAVEDSEVATFPDQYQPLYSWKTVASDATLEVRLNNEIRAALSGGAWQAKEPLVPKARKVATPPAKKKGVTPAKKDEGEVADTELTPQLGQKLESPRPEEFERLGIGRMRRADYTGASRAFKASLTSTKSNESPFAYFLLAQAEFSQGQFDAALRAVEDGAKANDQWAKADLDVRDFYPEGSTTFSQRLRELEGAVGGDASLSLLAGYMRFYSGDVEGALSDFDAYVAGYPSSKVAATYRSLARAKVDEAHGLEDF